MHNLPFASPRTSPPAAGILRPVHGISMVLVLVLSAWSSGSAAQQSQLATLSRNALDLSCSPFLEELRDPPTLEARDGEIRTSLTAEKVNKCINGKVVQLQSYLDSQAGTDSRPVGPAYVLRVGEAYPDPVLRIHFSNELAGEGKYECGHNSPDVDVCTNLHTHGLHVSPKGNSDNVFLDLAPGDTEDYKFDIPNFHAPGTHWIHAHLHGSTAPQVRNGMSGALILKGAIDDWLATYGISGRREKIMILQQLQFDGSPVCGEDADGTARTTSINGQCLPLITVQEGEVQHWRLIDSGIDASVSFGVETGPGQGEIRNIPFYEFAKDGINLGRAVEVPEQVTLQPGYRSDILIQIPMVDDYCPGADRCELRIVDEASEASKSLMGVAEPHNVIAKVIINRSNTRPMTMPPSDDPHFAKPYPEITDDELSPQEQHIYFANVPNSSGGTDKTVNGKVYPDTDTVELKLNDAQTWKVWVGEKQESTASHPFHIHVNPFEVIERDAAGKIVNRYWKDTILISGSDNKGEENAVELRSRYENFDGAFVLHCHNLEHEDQGMMMKVVVNP